SFQNKRVNTDNLQVILVVKDIGWNYSKVQDAINAAEDEATIIVSQGTYEENIDFGDKEIHLSSSTPTDMDVAASTVIAPADQDSPVVTINGNQTKAILEGFKITGGATGLYCEAASPEIRYNIISDVDKCAVIFKTSDALLNNNNLGSNATAVYMTNSEPEIYNNTIRGTERAIDVVSSTPTVYDNMFITINKQGNGVYVDINSNVKNEEEALWQVFNVPYARQADVENYTDGATSNTFISDVVAATVRDVNLVEGQYIQFEREPTQTKDGTFTLSPAIATSNQGENITIQATYTPSEFFSNGTITYTVDETIDLNEVYITINGQERRVENDEIGQDSHQRMKTRLRGKEIKIRDISTAAEEPIILKIVQTPYLCEQTNPRTITIKTDRDGQGSLYTPSEQQSDSFIIENKLENLGEEGTAFDIIENESAPFWSYTVKVYKDEMSNRLQELETWKITVDESTYEFRENVFDSNILQTDDIPNEDGEITKQEIKEGQFEPNLY
ncbi:MAG: hypothetical protein U9N62_10065, partial [Thermotogota bacterium]|nr:hypothetical protein [Thermotogota bacterium]